MGSKRMNWRRSVLLAPALAAVLLATGCSACADVHCGVDPNRPRFGDGTKKLFRDMAHVPTWAAKEATRRSELLAEFGEDWWYNRSVEFERTSDRVVNLPSTIAGEFEYHGGALVGFFERQGKRAGVDSCCFFDRAWHSIKQAGRF
jgi:hypothetical protein